MSTDEEMKVIGRMVTEFTEIKRRVTALEEQAWRYGEELGRIVKVLNSIRFGSLEIDLTAMPTREEITELLADLQAARERRDQLQASLNQLGLGG